MKVRTLCGLLLCLVSFCLSGCWDAREMEDRSYSITMGIDKNETEGGRYLVSLAPAQLSAVASGEETKNTIEDAGLLTVTGDTLAASIRQADTYSSKQVYLGQLKTVVLGKGILEDKVLLTSLLDELERNTDISGKIILLGTEETAKACVSQILAEDASTGLFIWEFYKNTAEDVAVTKKLELESFLRELRENKGTGILPKISMTEKGIHLGGGIALWEYALCGVLSDDEEKGVLLLQGEGNGAVIEGIWQNTVIPLWVYDNKSYISFTEAQGRLVCHVDITLSGSVEGGALYGESLFQSQSMTELENIFETIIKSKIENTIAIAQKIYQKDVFHFSTMLRKKEPKLYKQYGDSPTFLQDLIFDVTVTPKIKNIGVIE